MDRTNRQRRATAYHEASHIAVALHYGFEIKFAVIDNDASGCTMIAGTPKDYHHHISMACDDEIERERVRECARRRIEICAAGSLGEAIELDCCVPYDGGDRFLADEFRASTNCARIEWVGADVVDAIEQVDADSLRVLLRQLWPRIEVLAAGLLQAGVGVRVPGRRLSAIFREAGTR